MTDKHVNLEALTTLIGAARGEPDTRSWAAALLARVKDPVDAIFIVEVLNSGATSLGDEVLNSGGLPRCSFCLKSSADVRRIVSSPNANICTECIEIAREAATGPPSPSR